MRRMIILCEGPTEETFINRILQKEFYTKNIFVTASSFGGVSKYSIVKRQIQNLCKSDSSAIITTMLDYYGMPSETPGIRNGVGGNIYEKVCYAEQCIKEDIALNNFIPNLLLHEFEGLLFSKPECFAYCGITEQKIKELCEIRRQAETPEHINNSPETAPSKRILKIYPQYCKPIDGYNIALDIGIHRIRQECKHFDNWLKCLEQY